MSQMVAVLQSDPVLLRCLLHRLDPVVDLGAGPGKVLGLGYFENGKVLLRKRPSPAEPSLEALAEDVKSELLVAASHRPGVGGFREAETEPFRFRGWIFAGTGRILPLGERGAVLASMPEFLRRGLAGNSDAELAFFVTLGHVWEESRSLDLLDIEPEVAGRALAKTLRQLDERAAAAGVERSQTSALVSNGRMLAAVRRGQPLSYALVEGLQECEVCGLDRQATENDARARPHRLMKAVVFASSPRPDGLQWIEVPENHLVTVSRNLSLRLSPLG